MNDNSLCERQCSPTHEGEPNNNEIRKDDTEPNVLGVASCSAPDSYDEFIWKILPPLLWWARALVLVGVLNLLVNCHQAGWISLPFLP
jgi:hypothetical protein